MFDFSLNHSNGSELITPINRWCGMKLSVSRRPVNLTRRETQGKRFYTDSRL